MRDFFECLLELATDSVTWVWNYLKTYNATVPTSPPQPAYDPKFDLIARSSLEDPRIPPEALEDPVICHVLGEIPLRNADRMLLWVYEMLLIKKKGEVDLLNQETPPKYSYDHQEAYPQMYKAACAAAVEASPKVASPMILSACDSVSVFTSDVAMPSSSPSTSSSSSELQNPVLVVKVTHPANAMSRLERKGDCAFPKGRVPKKKKKKKVNKKKTGIATAIATAAAAMQRKVKGNPFAMTCFNIAVNVSNGRSSSRPSSATWSLSPGPGPSPSSCAVSVKRNKSVSVSDMTPIAQVKKTSSSCSDARTPSSGAETVYWSL